MGHYQAAEIPVPDSKIEQIKGHLPLGYLEKAACSLFYEAEISSLRGVRRYFSSLVRRGK